eukprot:TRINITY_DN892_c0_g1_i2.p1 TRINITY_DN892_c0_g1~~TRINITY_DN892_c0_g1_i2.p1  ORF type:complete len:156 (+),score=39.09 TRINITY_DN892_c0_g1_i2:45-512(+)
MGLTNSNLREEDIEEMQKVSNFSASEIKQLYKRFKRLDRDDTGTIGTDEFLCIPELAMNPLAMRVISLFETDRSGRVNFQQFVQTLSVFSLKGTEEEKIKFAFRIYDLNDDGFIDQDELFEVLKMMVGNNLKDRQLWQIVHKTMADSDIDGERVQ